MPGEGEMFNVNKKVVAHGFSQCFSTLSVAYAEKILEDNHKNRGNYNGKCHYPKIICDMVAPLNEQWAVSFQEQINRRGYAGRKQQENFQFREQEQRPILRRLCIKLTSRSLPETQQVARMIMEFPGKDALYMRFEDTGEQILRASAVSVNNELVDRLEKMLGCDRVVVQNLKS
jgi:hypothetical protein